MSLNAIHRRIAAVALIASASMVMAGVANAASVTTFEPKTVVAALTEAGYKAKLDRNEDNEPYVESASGGNDIRLAFSGCDNGASCDQMEFIAIWTCKDEVKVCSDAASKWNEDENFSHALITGDSVALYYHLLFDKGGVSPKLFVDNFEMFAGNMDAFIDLVMERRGK